MGVTISNLSASTAPSLADLLPVTQTVGLGNITHKMSLAQLLSVSGVIYAADPLYGVRADGSTDDTAAWNSAFNAAVSRSMPVIAPLGVSMVSAIQVPSNVMLLGHNTGPLSPTQGSVIKALSNATAPTVGMQANSRMQDIQIQGNGTTSAVQFIGDNVTIAQTSIANSAIGLDFGLRGLNSLIAYCSVTGCTIGVSNAAQSRFIVNSITKCNTNVSLNNKSNNNQFSNNYFGYSTTYNVQVVQSTKNGFTGNLFDAAGSNHISLVQADYTNIVANRLGRAGRNQGSVAGTSGDASFYLQNNKAVNISSNTTWVGQDDGGIGYVGPFWAVYDAGSNTNCIISNNILAYANNSTVSGSGPINSTSTFNLAAGFNQSFWSGAV